MSIVFLACGLNHKSAPLAVREKIALPLEALSKALINLIQMPSIHEAVILSTCNRTEFYCEASHSDDILPWLCERYHLDREKIEPYFYFYEDDEALRHLLKVACGLDSMMIGEPQIFGQMKHAYQEACDFKTVDTHLHNLFQYVFNAAKRIRSQSGIGSNPVSIAFAGVQLIGNFFNRFDSLTAFLIGSGETSGLIAKYLQKQGVTDFIISSRTPEHAYALAKNVQGKVVSLSEIPHYLASASVVVSATNCPIPFISKEIVQSALIQNHGKPLFFLDLSVPRDVTPDVTELENVHLYNIDDLHQVIDKGLHARKIAAIKATELIDKTLHEYKLWHQSLKAQDLICHYRLQMEDLAKEELNRALQKLSNGQSHYEVLSEFSERLVNKLTHKTTIGLKQVASENRQDLLELAQYLFNLAPAPGQLIRDLD